MAIEHLILSNGERYPILVDSEGLPDFWVTLYVTEVLRPTHKQTSIANALGHIVHFKLWEEINGRDLAEEFSQIKFLSDQDIHSLRDHCLHDTKSVKKWQRSVPRSNVVKMPAASVASSRPLYTVSKDHAANRLHQIASYLDFLARTILRNGVLDKGASDSIADMKKRLLANKPKGRSGLGLATDPNTKAPPPEIFEEFMAIVKEDSPENPFKNEGIKLRNSLMFELLYDLGLRTGELLALRVGDVDIHTNRIEIIRRHDDLHDARKIQPVPKTSERSLQVKKSLIKRLDHYIKDVRQKIDQAIMHPYLFVAHKKGKFSGSPISNSTFFNRILKPVIAVNPDRFEDVARHGFRHNFNYRLSKRIDAVNEKAKTDPKAKKISEKEEVQLRKYLNGWISDKTAEVYNLRHIKEEADRVMLADIDHWTGYIKERSKD